jgi:hypothetical protein
MPDSIGSTGWQLVSDPEAGAVHLEHVDSGHSYVLDDEGGVRVPGSEDIGGELRALRSTIASEREDSTTVTGSGIDTQAEISAETCTVQCDGETGEVTIRGATVISVDAPVVDVSGRERVDVRSVGGVNVTGEDRFEEDT